MGSGDQAGRRSVDTITVTCTIDSRAHEVPDAELAAAARRSDGHYQALCGHMVAAAPMVEPDGQPCLLCTAILERTQATRRGTRQRILG
ncbi:hypothetical protein [Pseudonocardia adelaidensis]|uniref:Zinc finger protein n=1 Tax=Pseudonocardia adelaidensis TaxID=648754 RepID=A0ABP9PAS9_9PSEU